MTRTRGRAAGTLGLVVLLGSYSTLRADVRADEKGHVEFAGMLGKMVNLFGGKAAREGTASSVAVKGDRKATFHDTKGQIVDLSEEKVYEIDLHDKTYTVTTFAELRRRMEEARKKAEEARQQAQAESKATAEKSSQPSGEKPPEYEVDVDIKNTGQRKTINGFDTQETVMTITVRQKGKTLEENGGLVLTSDMWMAPKIAAMKEVVDFDQRYWAKLNGTQIFGASPEQMAAAIAQYPMMKDAIAKMRSENVKIDGTPILSTVTIDGVKSAEQMAAEQKQNHEETKSSTPTSVNSMLGGFAKKMAKKKTESEPSQRTGIMTMTSELVKVTTDVSAGDVSVPVGFKESK